MRTYTYKAYDVDGKHHKGKEDAPSEEVMRNDMPPESCASFKVSNQLVY